jgi:hypothetical protein
VVEYLRVFNHVGFFLSTTLAARPPSSRSLHDFENHDLDCESRGLIESLVAGQQRRNCPSAGSSGNGDGPRMAQEHAFGKGDFNG